MTKPTQAKTAQEKNVYLTLLTSTLLLSSFTFGGGYVIVPLMRKRFVEELGWIEEDEMLNIIAVAQSAPGPIAVNASILVGRKMAGIPGSLLTLLGTITPPLITITVIAGFYSAFRSSPIVAAALYCMQAGVAAIIVDVIVTMASKVIRSKSRSSILIMLAAFIVGALTAFSVSYIILASGIIGALCFLRQSKKTKNAEAKDKEEKKEEKL